MAKRMTADDKIALLKPYVKPDKVTIQQAIMKLAAKLRKQYPQEDGKYAIVRITPLQTTFDEGFTGDPTADTRPDFVKQDEVGWTVIGKLK
jgi:hypothetical protein